MDMNESPLWPIQLADWLDRTISVWHDHRTPVLLVVLTCLIVLKFYLRRGLDDDDQVSGQRANGLSKGEEVGPLAIQKNEEIFSATPAIRRPLGPKRVEGRRPLKEKAVSLQAEKSLKIQLLVFYCSLTGTTTKLAAKVVSQLTETLQGEDFLPAVLHDISYIDLDDYFISGPKDQSQNARCFYILLIPSYNIDSIITNFLAHLDETHNDFRIDTAPLSGLAGYSVFGLGDKEGWPTEKEGFCCQAIQVDRWMAKLTGRKRAYPLGLGDVKSNYEYSLAEWFSGIQNALKDFSVSGNLGEGVPGSGAAAESGDEDAEDFPDTARRKRQKTSAITDLEDVRGPVNAPLPIDFTTSNTPDPTHPLPLKPMVPKTSPTYAALTKQGYTIVGSHSGVKICRWTKSALRGRGSCYKNSFYGIRSHLCMEATPSLSCSNKCVFCWRHGTNPVSTVWRWETDPPDLILAGAKAGHYQKIKMLRGVPGVRAARFEEAMRIRHCALSLVGEPIFYPHINEFLNLLHAERISSFLVCNAQHPQPLATLNRVTQLYVSIDASNRDSLKRIDRPLHRDFWERFLQCLDLVREKRFVQRTVYRLTLVKGFNVEDEVEGYAGLVERGLPCFVEVKGVTYCGTSTSAGAGLTMQNVPFYEEIVEFVQGLERALAAKGLEYGIAAEHRHSCCVLLASKRFLREGRWCTRIDYESFFDLLESGNEFSPEDYSLPTPEWALWGNGGFDPADERVDRKGRPKVEN